MVLRRYKLHQITIFIDGKTNVLLHRMEAHYIFWYCSRMEIDSKGMHVNYVEASHA